MGYSSKTVAECVNRVRAGETIAAVSRDTGISDSAISVWCKVAGVRPAMSHARRTEEELMRASRMWADGATAREIAAELGIADDSVYSMTYKRRDLFPARGRGGPRYTKERVRALEREVERLREILRENGIDA